MRTVKPNLQLPLRACALVFPCTGSARHEGVDVVCHVVDGKADGQNLPSFSGAASREGRRGRSSDRGESRERRFMGKVGRGVGGGQASLRVLSWRSSLSSGWRSGSCSLKGRPDGRQQSKLNNSSSSRKRPTRIIETTIMATTQRICHQGTSETTRIGNASVTG